MVFPEVHLSFREVLASSSNEVLVCEFLVHLLVHQTVSPDNTESIEALFLVILGAALKPDPRDLEVLLDFFAAHIHPTKISRCPRSGDER